MIAFLKEQLTQKDDAIQGLNHRLETQRVACMAYRQQAQRLTDVLHIVHDSRLKDRDVRAAIALYNYTDTFPSDTDLLSRPPKLVRMTDLGAVFGKDKSVGSTVKKGLEENGLIEVEKRYDGHGHKELYIKAGKLPDRTLTKEDLRTTHRKADAAARRPARRQSSRAL